MKRILIFCLALNIALAGGLVLVFYLGNKDIARREEEQILKENAEKKESLDMIEKAGLLYADEKYLDARVQLRMASYRLYSEKYSEASKIIRMGECYFFVNEDTALFEEENKNDFFAFVGALLSLLSEEVLSEEENTLLERIKISYESMNFEAEGYPSLASYAEADEKTLNKKGLSLLGEKAVIERCENSSFPLACSFSGKNTFVSFSKLGGKLIRLYFYPGDEASEKEISFSEAMEIMKSFISKERLIGLSVDERSEDERVYYARFTSDEYEKANLIIGVKKSGGRVCLFEADSYYKYYKSDK